jgi:hypothetical protein
MKGTDALFRSYSANKQQFEKRQATRIKNREEQIKQIQVKIEHLQDLLKQLQAENAAEGEFESFDSFRQRAIQSHEYEKRKKEQS